MSTNSGTAADAVVSQQDKNNARTEKAREARRARAADRRQEQINRQAAEIAKAQAAPAGPALDMNALAGMIAAAVGAALAGRPAAPDAGPTDDQAVAHQQQQEQQAALTEAQKQEARTIAMRQNSATVGPDGRLKPVPEGKRRFFVDLDARFAEYLHRYTEFLAADMQRPRSTADALEFIIRHTYAADPTKAGLHVSSKTVPAGSKL